MIKKHSLIGIFINKQNILCFLETLKNKYKIPYSKIFVFEIKNNNFEYLVTFNVNDKELFLSEMKHSHVMHLKNECLFSINALNKIIEKENGYFDKNYQINWDFYKNKLIILTKGILTIEELNKIDDKSLFFK